MTLRLSVLFIGGLIVAGYIALSKIDIETLRGNVVSVMRNTTGLPIEIAGDVKWQFSLRPRVVMNDVSIKNADWAKNPYGVKIDQMYVSLDLFSLFSGQPTISKVRLINPHVFLEEDDKGQYSMVQKLPEKKEDPIDKSYPFDIDFGFSILELENPNISVITPVSRYDWSPDAFRIEYKDGGYSGYISKDDKVYPFIVGFSKLNTERKVYPVSIAFADGGNIVTANLALEATSKLPIDFKIKGDVQDLQGLLSNFNLSIPKIAPMNLNISGGMDHNKLIIHKSVINILGNDLEFSGSYDWLKVPSVYAKLKSKNFALGKVFPNLYGVEKPKWIRPNRKLNVFEDTDVSKFFPHNINISADISIDNMNIYRDMMAKNSEIKLVSTNDKLNLEVKTNFADGDIHTRFVAIKKPGEQLYIKMAGMGERIYVGEILNEIREKDSISELPANFELYLQTHGHDLTDLMKNLYGPFYVYSVGRGYAHSDLVEYFYGQDLLTQLRHSAMDLLRRNKKYDTIGIDCAVVNLKFRGGYVESTRGIAVESSAINMRAAGFVDLGNEKLKASFVTTPVRGIKLSVTGNVINSTEFSGDLAEPDIKISGNTVAAKAISATGIGILLAPFTGGIGLVAGAGIGFLAGDMLENWLADEHPCKTARKVGAEPEKDDPEWLNKPLADLIQPMLDGTDINN